MQANAALKLPPGKKKLPQEPKLMARDSFSVFLFAPVEGECNLAGIARGIG